MMLKYKIHLIRIKQTNIQFIYLVGIKSIVRINDINNIQSEICQISTATVDLKRN